MKRLIILILLTLIITTNGIVLASDIDDAIYYGTVRATNSGASTASNVAANCSINSTAWITSGIINSTITNVAVRNNSGADNPFMPGNGNNPWMFFYGNVPGNGNTDLTLYTNASGGTTYYFPDDAGMTTSDDADLELSDNFTIEVSGMVNTNNGSGKYLYLKENALYAYISPIVSGNLTVDIVDTAASHNGSYASPTTASGSGWSNPTNVRDGDTGTYTEYTCAAGVWTSYLIMPLTEDLSGRTQYYMSSEAAGQTIQIDVYYDAAWHTILTGTPTLGSMVNADMGLFRNVTQARWRAFNNDGSSRWFRFHEFRIDQANDPVLVSATTTGVSYTSHGINITADTSYLRIYVDSVESANVSLSGVSVPDTANDTYCFQNGVMPYVEYLKVWVDGTLQQNIQWNYGSTFTDLSGNNHDSTPSFRTTSSNSSVTATLISFMPVQQAITDSDSALTWGEIISEAPEEPETAYTEEERPGIFFEPLVHTLWGLSDLPDSVFWYNFAFIIIIGAGLLTFFIFAKNNQTALLLKCLIMITLMVFFALPGLNIYGMFVSLYFGMWCFGIIILSRSYGL